MELDISKSIISTEQTHSFAVLMVEDIKSYIKEHMQDFIIWLLEDASDNVIQTIAGIVDTSASVHKYSLCKY